MFDLISGLFIEVGLLAGVIILVLSFFKRFEKHRTKLMVTGVILIVIGVIFFDTNGLSEAYQNGMEFGKK